MDETILKNAIESILFVSGQPISIKRLKEVFAEEASAGEVEAAINNLIDNWKNNSGSLEIVETGGGLRFRTKAEYAEHIKRAFAPKPRSMTAPSLETLAIIAYRQPITRPEIEKLRGVDCGGVLKTLTDKDLIKIIGRKEEPGLPILYATTPQFLELFGINSLTELPPLKDVDEMKEDLASRAMDSDDDLASFIAAERESARGEFLGDEEALNELEGRLKEVRKLERDIFPSENSETTVEAAEVVEGVVAENAEQNESNEIDQNSEVNS